MMQYTKTTPEPPPMRDNGGEILALLKGLFAWYISQNWALRLFPVLLGIFFYEHLQGTSLIYFLWVQGAIEMIKAINVLLYNFNVSIIQLNYLKRNLQALLGITASPLHVRKPDADFSERAANANANANANIFSGQFLQKRIEERLLASEGRELANPKEPKPRPILQPSEIAFLKYDASIGQDIYNIDGVEYSRRDIVKRHGAYRAKTQSNPTETALIQASYWNYCREFVDNSERERGKCGGAKFEIVSNETEE